MARRVATRRRTFRTSAPLAMRLISVLADGIDAPERRVLSSPRRMFVGVVAFLMRVSLGYLLRHRMRHQLTSQTNAFPPSGFPSATKLVGYDRVVSQVL